MVAVLAVLAGTVPAAAALTDEQRRVILGEAQQAYDRGASVLRTDPEGARNAFRESADRFRQLVDDGIVNGRLEYDLGNAHLQAGDLGEAILHYRRALALIPGDDRLEHNLAYARSLRLTHIPESGERAIAGALLAWHYGTPLGGRFVFFLVVWVVLWILLGMHLFRGGPVWRWTALLFTVLSIGSGVSVAADVLLPHRQAGVVLADDVMVRKGNGEGFEPQFAEPLHPGVEFELLALRGDWIQIELPDGKTGWVREEQVGMVEGGRH